MTKKSCFYFEFLTVLLPLSLAFASDPLETDPPKAPTPLEGSSMAGTIRIRNIGNQGIGYDQGYTTLEGFFVALRDCNRSWAPFIDLRGHVFNNGKWAANAGLGARYISSSRVWGMGGYYDYRRTSHVSYNQVSLNLETLGKIWDFRLNGYLPVGKKSSIYGSPQFSAFTGGSIILSRKQEFAMKGANAAVGVHIDTFENAPLYLAFGSYYLQGHSKVAWGGEVHAYADIYKYLRIEAITSYDNVFKWIGQGQLGVNIPLGRQCKTRSDTKACAFSPVERVYQRTGRHEIIPVKHHNKKTHAVNPLTGLPYAFIFVDNTSHSNGTFESPYPDLLTAQENSHPGDIIYVLAGNGSAYSMTSVDGFQMQNNQKIWGSGTSHTLFTHLGPINIAPLTPTRPVITNTGPDGSAVITLANNCEVAGLNIIGGSIGYGIRGTGGIINAAIQDNWISIGRRFTGDVYAIELISANNGFIGNNLISNLYAFHGNVYGIYAENSSTGQNQIAILDNSLSSFHTAVGDMYGIYGNAGASGSPMIAINNNQVFNFDSRDTSNLSVARNTAIYVNASGNSQAQISVTGNRISDFFAPTNFAAVGILVQSLDTSTPLFALANNTISNFTNTASGIETKSFNASSMRLSITNNQVSNFPPEPQDGILVTTTGSSTTCVTLINNVATPTITLSQLLTSTLILDGSSQGNEPAPVEEGTITPGSCP